MKGQGRRKRLKGYREPFGKSIYIYTNGTGEKTYFNAIPTRRTYYNEKGLTVTCILHERDPLSLVKKAINHFQNRKNKERVVHSKYVVFDKDDFPNCISAVKLASEYDFNIAFSNPCFEVWIAYHFQSSLPSGMKQSHALDLATQLMKKSINYDYNKVDPNLYDVLLPYLDKAIEYATEGNKLRPGQNIVNKNPYTSIYKIIVDVKH